MSHGHEHGDDCSHGSETKGSMLPGVGGSEAGAGGVGGDASALDGLSMKGITEVDIFAAVELGWLHRVRELLEAPGGLQLMDEKRTVEQGTPVHFACLHGQIDILQYFMRLASSSQTDAGSFFSFLFFPPIY